MLEDDQYTIDILDIALDVIEGLGEVGREPQRPSELARQLALNRTRVFRILKTLEKRGYVNIDPQSQGYRLGLKFLSLGEKVKEQMDLRREAAPILMELAKTTGDAANLIVLYGESAVCLDGYQGEPMLQVFAPIGQPLPLHIGASPKLLLAYLPEPERERLLNKIELKPYTSATITDREELRKLLDRICAQGYSVDEQDFESGVFAFGAPVRDHTGSVVAGITVTTPASRYSPARRESIIELVVNAGRKLSEKLGYQPELRTLEEEQESVQPF